MSEVPARGEATPGTALDPAEIRDALVKAPLPAWARRLVTLLDDGIRIPIVGLRIGLDPILGALLPVAGDAITSAGSASLLLLALRERVPAVVLLRMVLNIGVDTLLGSVPVVGDLFDAFYKSNRKNLDLLERHRGEDRDPGAVDYALVGLGLTLAALSVVLPIVGLSLVGASLWALVERLFS